MIRPGTDCVLAVSLLASVVLWPMRGRVAPTGGLGVLPTVYWRQGICTNKLNLVIAKSELTFNGIILIHVRRECGYYWFSTRAETEYLWGSLSREISTP
jgi:hypothetical protein